MSIYKRLISTGLLVCLLFMFSACSNNTINNQPSSEGTIIADASESSLVIDKLSNSVTYEYTLNDSSMVDDLRNFSYDLNGETFLSKGKLNGQELAISIDCTTDSKLTVKIYPIIDNAVDNANCISFNNEDFKGAFFSLDCIETAYLLYSKEYNAYILYSESLNSNPDTIDTSLSDKVVVVYDANAKEIAYTYIFYFDNNELQSISENRAKEDYNEVYKYMDNFTTYSSEVANKLNNYGLNDIFINAESVINTAAIPKLIPIGKLETELGRGKGHFSYISYIDEE